MYNNAGGRVLMRLGVFSPGQKPVGIHAVDNIHLMPPTREFMRESLHEDPIASKIKGLFTDLSTRKVEGIDEA